ncbi:MAG: hypothetical protein ACLGHN_10660 [Bacteriovoracia bacterium]
MKIFLIISAVMIFSSSCDYREYPQEEEWKENIEDQIEEREERKD